MADQKITALNELAEADVASTDVLPIADISASETKKVTVKSLVEQGVDLIDDASIPAAKLASISPSSLGSSSTAKEFIAGPTGAGGAYSSRVIASGDLPVATDSALGAAAAGTGLTSTSGTFSVDAATAANLGGISVPSASGLSVNGSGVISHQSSVTGQTKNGFTVNASGHITAVGSIAAGDLPKATSSTVGGVFIGSGLSVTASGQLNHTDSITAGTTSGITFNSEGHITATTALTGTDLPSSTTSAKGGVSVPSGALSVNGSGALTHDNSGVTAGDYAKVTVDARGHVTAGTTLAASDIPDISAAKLTSGTIGTSLIANDAVTGGKLANGSVTRFAGAPDTNGVVSFGTADFDGQLLYDSTNENLYIYDGNAFKSIDIVSGEIVFAGTYDASTNLVASVTAKGTAIGLTVGQALISPASSNLNHYLTVSKSGTGSGNAPAEALAPPDFLLSTGTAWQVLDLSTALAATAASNVSFAPTGNIAGTDVQAAIVELDTEKLAANNPNMTGTATFAGDVVLGTASSLTFEGSSADDYETTFAITNPTADRTITFPNVTGTIITTGDSGTVTNAMLAGSIALTKLASLTSGQLIVGNSSNVAAAVALSGDATISNSGALTIANDAVTAAKLADTSVTAGSYTAADITVDAQGRITSAASGTIGTAEIADDAITADKLSDTSVTAGSYTAADITVDAQGRVTAAASGTIGTSEIANDAVTADKLADTAVTAGSYTAADITVDAQGRITSAASGTIGTSEISDDAVTADKLADTSVTAGSYTFSSITVDAQGRITAASSGTQADTDKITEGNTEAEVVDTGSDGHFKVTTENTERIRVGPAGQIGIAGANYGTSGQVLTSGGASGAISWADAAGGSTFEATASGAIANGDPIIVQANGTVKKPTQTITASIAEPSDGQEFDASCFGPAVAYDPINKKSLVIYNDQNASGTLKGRTVTIDNTQALGSQITYGTEFTISTNAADPLYGTNAAVYCDTAKLILVVYRGDDSDVECRTIDMSTSTPTVGSEVQVNGNGGEIAAVYDANADRVVVGYLYSNRKARVVNVTAGSSPSVGSEVTVDSASQNVQGSGSSWNILVYDSSAQKVVNLYHKVNSSQTIKRGTAKVGTVDASAESISFGTAADFSSVQANPESAIYHPTAGKVIVMYHEIGDVDMYYAVGTVSGTGISFATSVQMFADQDSSDVHNLAYDSNTDLILHSYERYVTTSANRRMYVRTATISGNTVTFASNEADIFSANNNFDHHASVFDSDQKRVFLVARNSSDGNAGEGWAIRTGTRTSDLTTENYIGIADGAYADGATATVQIVGSVDDAQSSLTPGQSYFVQFDGSLALTPDDTSVFAGTAVAATKLIVKG